MSTNTMGVEQYSVEFVPATARHGSVRSLFTMWFGANMHVLCVAAGAATLTTGMSLWWSLLAVLLGNLIGGIFMALHSAQGPKLGIPQMIQSRAQFGYFGAIIPLLLVIFMYIGYFASSDVLAGQAIADQFGIPPELAIVLSTLCVFVITVYGYKLIHFCEKWMGWLSAILFVYLSVELFGTPGIGHAFHSGGFSAGGFMLGLSIAVIWQLTYAPYVADYSRYLPENTSIRACFWYTYAGNVVSSVWGMAFGAIAASVATEAFASGSIGFMLHLAPEALLWPIFLIVVVALITDNGLNLYGSFMCTTTILTAFMPSRLRQYQRIVIIAVCAIVGAIIAITGRANFLENFSNFIALIAYFLIPWTAVNLVDFYLIRKERYAIPDIFDPSGVYGKLDWRAMGAYLAGIVLELPFVNTTFFAGPLVAPLGGADVSWIVGLIISSAVYYWAMKTWPPADLRALRAAGSVGGSRHDGGHDDVWLHRDR
ncbi:purine-cytosine permease family protein [Sciscionella sediminilitoris]|uniref:purine-cytosine permease family protein n=1 Tax=Sciscionella sediminilitoris TaxID=1445613 RepID=UPI00068EBD3A|nr:cytosine permease [Sciscionella sp. SE31]